MPLDIDTGLYTDEGIESSACSNGMARVVVGDRIGASTQGICFLLQGHYDARTFRTRDYQYGWGRA